MTDHLEYARRSIKGKRQNQEDSCDFALIGDEPAEQENSARENGKLLAVLADGMGGHVGGAFASRTLCAEFIETYKTDTENGSEFSRLDKALGQGNHAILKRVQEDESLAGMGSTFIGAVIDGHNLQWISVGDSLLYHFRDGRIERINENHAYSSILEKMVESGELTELEARKHPQRNALLSAVTGQKIEKINQPEEPLELEEGDWLVLASDGLLSVSQDFIASVIYREQTNGAQAVVNALIDGVIDVDYPRQDNTTVMAVRIGECRTSAFDIRNIPAGLYRILETMSPQIAARWVVGAMAFVIVAALSLIMFRSEPEPLITGTVEQDRNIQQIMKDLGVVNEAEELEKNRKVKVLMDIRKVPQK